MTIVTIDDFRAAGICPRSKFWFERHGLDWRGFVKNGIDVQQLKDTGDHADLVAAVEAAARKRNGKQ